VSERACKSDLYRIYYNRNYFMRADGLWAGRGLGRGDHLGTLGTSCAGPVTARSAEQCTAVLDSLGKNLTALPTGWRRLVTGL